MPPGLSTPLQVSALHVAETLSGLAPDARQRFASELLAPVAGHLLSAHARGARVVGLYGAQGSGKSTLARGLGDLLRAHVGLRVAVLSLDDFYLTRAHRRRVAARMHPLFDTRGVPGTHDVSLLQRTMDALLAPRDHTHPVHVPRFDKSRDDRAPEADTVLSPVDLVLLEGWCLGVPPEPAERLLTPCSEFELQHDEGGRFRRCVNYRLTTDYASLARRLDWLLALMVDSFDVSCRLRLKQEQALRSATGAGMSDREVQEFMQRFERVSRWGLLTMAERADLVVRVDEQHVPHQRIPAP